MIKTAAELLDNSSHMDWLTSSQKILVEAMMESYHELKSENQTVWVVQHIDTLIISGICSSQEKAVKITDGSSAFAVVNMQVV